MDFTHINQHLNTIDSTLSFISICAGAIAGSLVVNMMFIVSHLGSIRSELSMLRSDISMMNTYLSRSATSLGELRRLVNSMDQLEQTLRKDSQLQRRLLVDDLTSVLAQRQN